LTNEYFFIFKMQSKLRPA